jgi:hypothetical protein
MLQAPRWFGPALEEHGSIVLPGEVKNGTAASIVPTRPTSFRTGSSKTAKGGAPVIFQHVVPFPRGHEPSRSRSGAKVQIGRNDLQGADLSRRLLHGSVARTRFD